jgi:type II secretory pathway pseudopilin PulG
MSNERGITFIEMVISIVLIGIIGMIAAQAFLSSTESVLTANLTREATEVNRLAMDRMIREIRNVDGNRCISNATTATTFSFVDGQNNTIVYSWAGAGQPLMRNGTDPIVNSVSNLSFTYYNNASPPIAVAPGGCATPCAATCAATPVWAVQIDMTTQSGTETMQLRSQVQPRSF